MSQFADPIMVEIKILEDKKNKLIVEFLGADHTLCNALKSELWNDEHVKVAGYNIKHPLVGSPIMVIETDTSENPRKALSDSAKRLKKLNEAFKEKITKELR
jgi:DNA-directed RNA polymerase subunit L